MKHKMLVKYFNFLVLFTLVLQMFPSAALAYTEHFGGTINSETWGPGTHYVSGAVTVNDNQVLTIMPGAVVKFAPNTQLTVYGTLNAEGTGWEKDSRIVFTSMDDNSCMDDETCGEIIPGSDSDPLKGDWRGIYLHGYSTNDGIGEFDYCLIRYGGNSAGSANANVRFNYSDSGHFINSISEYSATDGVRISNCSPAITNSEFIENTRHGLYASGSGTPTVTGNVFTDNGKYGLRLDLASLISFSGNTGSGNGTNGIGLSGTVSADQTWSCARTFPIVLVSSVTVNNGTTLTLPAGTIIKADSDVQLTVYGTLDANGAAETPEGWVVFTSLKDDEYSGDTNGDGSTDPAQGDWRGIYLHGYSTNDGIGEFDYCLIRYGGNSAGSANANVRFNYSDSGHFINSISEYSATDGVRISNCSPVVTNSKFNENTRHGLYASDSGAPTVTGNVFTGNQEYGLRLNLGSLISFSGNTGSGNGTNGIGLSGTVSANQTWSCASTFPIVLVSSVTVNDGQTLTLPAGTIIKADSDVQLTVYGTLDANGAAETPEDWVVFTSLKDDEYGGDTNGDGSTSPAPGNWRGIYLHGYSTNDGIGEFDYCLIRYGGNSAGSADANVRFNYSDSGHFINSISEYSLMDGVRIFNCSPAITNSTVSNNTQHGLNVSSGSPMVTNCILWGDVLGEISGTGSPIVTYCDIQGGYQGVANIDEDPLFVDAENGDYHLHACSPCIDAGDPVETLTEDYPSGDFVIAVDWVTNISAGDWIWITDGVNYENDEVVNTTETTIRIANGFAHSYAVSDGAYVYTVTSDFSNESDPNGLRINMGAYGGTTGATTTTVCHGDFDSDSDVDGTDLAVFAEAFSSSDEVADFDSDGFVDETDLAAFAAEFGRTACPICP